MSFKLDTQARVGLISTRVILINTNFQYPLTGCIKLVAAFFIKSAWHIITTMSLVKAKSKAAPGPSTYKINANSLNWVLSVHNKSPK